jgi:hypothetical protein
MATTKTSLASKPLADHPLASQQLVNVHQAKTHLSQLLQEVEQGQEVVIAPTGGADCAAGGLAGSSPSGGGARGDARPDHAGR